MTDLEIEIQRELDEIVEKKQARDNKPRCQSLRASPCSKGIRLTKHGIQRYVERANIRGLSQNLVEAAIMGEISQSKQIGTGENERGTVRYLKTITGLIFVMSKKNRLITVLIA